MMLSFVPARIEPTVTTAVWAPRDLPGHHGLQAQHGRRRHHDRIDGGLRPRTVAALAEHPHPQRVRRGERGAGVPARHAGRHRRDVLAEHDIGLAEPLVQPVGDHRLGSAAELLGGLEHGQRWCPSTDVRAAASRSSAPSRQVTCMSWPHACITGTSLPSGVDTASGARVRQAGVLGDRQRVHVGTQQHGRAAAVAQHADHAGTADPLGHVGAQPGQPRATSAAVRTSARHSSGWACRSR